MAIDLTKRPLENPENHSANSGKGISFEKSSASASAAQNKAAATAPEAAHGSQGQTTEQVIEDFSTWQYYLKAFQLFGNMKGRARRKEYWGFALWTTVISFAMLVVDGALGFDGEYSPAYSLYALAAFIPGIAVWVRRMHDVGRSGWWFLIYFTGIGIFVLIYWMFKDSEPGPNKWGPNPKGVEPNPGWG